MDRVPTLSVLLALALVAAPLPGLAVEIGHRWSAGGPEGGWVGDLVFAPSEPGRVYALMLGSAYTMGWPAGHIFVSTDAGSTWRLADSAAVSPACESVTVDPLNADRLYASFWLEGVFRSDDGGRAWSSAREGLPKNPPNSSWSRFEKVSALAASREWPGTVLAVVHGSSTRDKVYISVDRGNQWIHAMDLRGIEFLELSPGAPEVAYVGSQYGDGLHRSRDGGVTWEPVTGLEVAQALSMAFDPTDRDRLWVGAAGVHLSTDGGQSWSHHAAGLDDPWDPGAAAPINSLAVDPVDPMRLVATSGTLVFRSSDGGLTWAELPERMPDICWWGIVRASPQPGEPLLGGSCGSGVLSLEGDSWVPSRTGLYAVPAVWLAADPQRPEVAYATAGSEYHNLSTLQRTTNGGHTWHGVTEDLDPCGVGSLAVDPGDAHHLVVSTLCVGDGLAASTDGGDTWSLVELPGEWPDAVVPIVFAPSDPRRMYAFRWDDMLSSSDGGATWEVVNAELRAPEPKAAAVHPTRPEVLYAGVSAPPDPCLSSLAVSTDGGRSWTSSSDGLPFGWPCSWARCCRERVSWIGIHPDRPDRILAVTVDHGLYLSGDAGRSWHASTAPVLPGGVAFVRDQPDTILVGGRDGDGVFISEDAGQTWRRLGVGLEPAPRVFALAPSADGNLVYAGTSTSVLHLHHAIPPRRPSGRLGRLGRP